ncbi:hypothetical protein KV580_04695 [Pseudomonas chlororaphis]|nr:hypothetical protein [Pseudomonas chlororaphis]
MTTNESKTDLHRLMLEAAEAELSINDISPIYVTPSAWREEPIECIRFSEGG